MLKISVVEGPRRCRLVMEGMLIEPWVGEVISEYEKVKRHLGGRKLVVDITNLSTLSPAGERVIERLLDDNAKFHAGVFMKQVLKQLTSKRPPK
jgi:hypothetical protein